MATGFRIGGKLLKITDGPIIKKGSIRTCLDLRVCSCGRVKVDIGKKVPNDKLGTECDCGIKTTSKAWWTDSRRWMPLDDLNRELSETTLSEIIKEKEMV